ALAKKVGSAFLISTGTDLAKDPKELEKLYNSAMELRPAIIFIDEADDLLRSREYSPNTAATNKLLTLMDGVGDKVRDIVWIAATNHPDQIDAALLRGGRFTEKVEFILPTGSQLVDHMRKWLDARKVSLADELTVDAIALTIGEESVANAEAVLQYAVNRAISMASGDSIAIGVQDIKSALAVVLGREE
ncbi:MAG: AAA family ATPase, partial [Burkholderiales bacterium]|nr:AAA family ATPase [Burkholderiales bacterium]